MALHLRTVLFGSVDSPSRRYEPIGLAVVLFTLTFAAYAFSVFDVAGGVVFLAFEAAIVGMLGAVWTSYRRHGLVAAWAVTYAALLGESANHYFLGQPPSQSFYDRAAAFVQLDGLVFLGIEALVLGTLAFLFGVFCGWGKSFIEDTITHRSGR